MTREPIRSFKIEFKFFEHTSDYWERKASLFETWAVVRKDPEVTIDEVCHYIVEHQNDLSALMRLATEPLGFEITFRYPEKVRQLIGTCNFVLMERDVVIPPLYDR